MSMSWFVYKAQTKRRYRVGIWLRTRSLPKSILDKARKRMRSKECIAWVVVKELQPDDYVLLEFWCMNPWKLGKDEIYTVFYLREKEDPDWICEGDLGRGLIGQK
jgi:hypothetical protein